MPVLQGELDLAGAGGFGPAPWKLPELLAHVAGRFVLPPASALPGLRRVECHFPLVVRDPSCREVSRS